MAKVGMIQRELKRQKLVAKHAEKRAQLKAIIVSPNATEDEKWDAQIQLQKLPVNSSRSRLQKRCRVTGRPHAVYKKFGLCRNKLREHAMQGDVPGLKKASW
ncbi:30S ribosomal protein S14 [Fangia hongkongensis]|uniref:30S ribosomal protein S14 n=1 Tax=Fangia hongkongensis TaxID=270495 RepID=UPI000379EB30|nr:30S ribosomal protein S14 [Fangia hongkongensis]MBK2125984.1 30S ribosomal protein S14 [Fangia hongkongensis]